MSTQTSAAVGSVGSPSAVSSGRLSPSWTGAAMPLADGRPAGAAASASGRRRSGTSDAMRRRMDGLRSVLGTRESTRFRAAERSGYTARPMLTLADQLLTLLIVLGLPLRAWFGMRALNTAPAGAVAGLRPRLWARAIASQWVLVALVLAVWIANHRSAATLGLVLKPTGGLAGVMIGLVTIVSIVLRQRGAVDTDESIRQRVRDRLAPVERLMPRQGSDFRLFAALACTAGLCEEFLFRGYLAWVAGLLLPFPIAPAVQALVFGFCHAYQGWRGIVMTTFAGAFLTAVVLISGSLWPAIAIHALMDLHAGDLARRVFPRDADAGSIEPRTA